jgi:hypothetical protein
MSMTTFQRLARVREWRDALDRASAAGGLTMQAIQDTLDLYDAEMMKPADARDSLFLPFAVGLRPQAVFDNTGRERGRGRFVSYELIEDVAHDLDSMLAEMLECGAWFAARRASAERPEMTPSPPSKDAIRKRKARAAGRVRARPKKPERDELAIQRKGVITREKKLAALQAKLSANPGGPDALALIDDIALTVRSLRRAKGTVSKLESTAALLGDVK